jgi:hypothetical protein
MKRRGLTDIASSAIIALSRRPCTLPTRAAFELVINLKTAKALGLTILELPLTCIDEVIE